MQVGSPTSVPQPDARLTGAQRALMQALWGRPGTPFADPAQFAAMVADREHLAATLEQQGTREAAAQLRRNNAAMRAVAQELDAGPNRPGQEGPQSRQRRQHRRPGR
jgi:hypothetical protein